MMSLLIQIVPIEVPRGESTLKVYMVGFASLLLGSYSHQEPFSRHVAQILLLLRVQLPTHTSC